MFTGLVEGQGEILQIIHEGAGLRFEIAPPWLAEHCPNHLLATIGESIAINGCCLTVIDIKPESLAFQAGQETLKRTNLGELKNGSKVNLERSLKLGDPLGGHMVQGHIDCTGKVKQIIQDGDWTNIHFSIPEEYSRIMVSKGSIAVDGVSLTLVDVEPTSFSVALIPHTLKITTLGQRKIGDTVNLEIDILAKQLAKLAEPLLMKLQQTQ